MNQNKLTWDILDRLAHPSEIARLLRVLGVRGRLKGRDSCPLAIATGYHVDSDSRRKPHRKFEELTPAEAEFVENFDDGMYPDLIEIALQVESLLVIY